MSVIIRSAMVLVMLYCVCSCSLAPVGTRTESTYSPLHLELATTERDVRPGVLVTVHVRLTNTSAAPLRDIDVALSHTPSLLPVGGTGSTTVHTEYSTLHIERILLLKPGARADWWLVLQAITSGEAHARAIALPATAMNASMEFMQWQVVDDADPPDDPLQEKDPIELASQYIARSLEHRARGQQRDELYALHTAGIFVDQVAPERVIEIAWAEQVVRMRELYQLEYGTGPAPLQQAPLPRTSMLTGVVVDRTNLSTIANATITLRSLLTDAVYASATTRDDGVFQIPDLGVEPAVMMTAMPGYVTTLRSGFELRPNALTRLTTELQPEPTQPRFDTWDLAELHGTLSGYRGDGARDVEVILVGSDTRAALTDEQGQFRFTDVTPGDYTFVAQKPGFSVIERRALSVTPGGEIEVQFTLEPEH